MGLEFDEAARRDVLRIVAPAKYLRSSFTFQSDHITFYTDDGWFADREHGRGVLFQILTQALLARFAHVSRSGIRVDVVRVDLKRYESKRCERGRLHDGHVVGGPDGRTGNIRSGARAHVPHIGVHAVTDGVEQLKFVQGIQQPESVAATNEQGFGSGNSLFGIYGYVDGIEVEAYGLTLLAGHRRVAIAIP